MILGLNFHVSCQVLGERNQDMFWALYKMQNWNHYFVTELVIFALRKYHDTLSVS